MLHNTYDLLLLSIDSLDCLPVSVYLATNSANAALCVLFMLWYPPSLTHPVSACEPENDRDRTARSHRIALLTFCD
jgi:hypothetical protein